MHTADHVTMTSLMLITYETNERRVATYGCTKKGRSLKYQEVARPIKIKHVIQALAHGNIVFQKTLTMTSHVVTVGSAIGPGGHSRRARVNGGGGRGGKLARVEDGPGGGTAEVRLPHDRWSYLGGRRGELTLVRELLAQRMPIGLLEGERI